MATSDPLPTELEEYGDLRLGREWMQIARATILAIAVTAMMLACVIASHAPDVQIARDHHDARIQPARADACSTDESE